MIANRNSWGNTWKREKISQLAMLMKGALAAESKVLIKMNCKAGRVGAITSILPSLNAPTVSALDSKGWVAVESVVPETVVREIIPKLKKNGAEGIVELPLNKIIL